MSLYIGIDWSERKHDLVMMNAAGEVVLRKTIAHSQKGFVEFDEARQRLGITAEDCVIGLETQHNLIVDFLWGQGYGQVYILPPHATQSSRHRFKSSPAHDDQDDAELIADLLRVDLHRFRPWKPGSALTQAIRSRVKFVIFETRQIVRLTNRLRAVLLRYYPAAMHVFSGLDTQIALKFIQSYPIPQLAAQLEFSEFQSFAKQCHYPNPTKLMGRFARLKQAFPQTPTGIVDAYQAEAIALTEQILLTVQTKVRTLHELGILYRQHPDHPIYDSLPQAGDFLGPALLAMLGDDRGRFPTANSLQVQAGTAPTTQRSGKHTFIAFRRACDRDFQMVAQQCAKASLHSSLWANSYFMQAVRRSHSLSHALRCLANRWLAILWRLWMEHQTYDESLHLARHARRISPIH
jgi:transposase